MDELNEITNQLYQKMVADKERVVYKKIKELGIDFDVDVEKKRRFKSIICCQYTAEETYYYNDGSVEGLRIVTFIQKVNDINFNDDVSKLGFEIKYY